ncbi:hydroquinone glucosyltransferase [Trifolium repens]|nr:hydroquinone glucosyltransferase [Trifolium repens]
MEHQQSVTTLKQELLPPLVAMFPTPGMGHLIPMIEFAKRLTNRHNLLVTFIIPIDGPPTKAQTTVLASLPSGISHIFLPPVTLSDLPPDTKPESFMSITIFRSLPSLHQTLISLMTSHRLSALILDLFSTDAFDTGAELNIPSYLFFPTTANNLCFAFYFPQLDQQVQCEFREIPEPLNIPGCFAVHGKDLADPVQDRNSDAYKPKIGENELVERDEIASVVKRLMVGEEGKKIRYRMNELKDAASNALKANGSSTKQICELALKWKGVSIPN